MSFAIFLLLVFHEASELRLPDARVHFVHLREQLAFQQRIRALLESRLHDVAGDVVLDQEGHALDVDVHQEANDGALVLLRTFLQHSLQHVVPELVSHQLMHRILPDELLHQCPRRSQTAHRDVLDDPLNDPAAVDVARHLHDVVGQQLLHDEAGVVNSQLLDALLHHVVRPLRPGLGFPSAAVVAPSLVHTSPETGRNHGLPLGTKLGALQQGL
mmetsp:Transcript_115313/g.366629  ORF Transcript_115313/g.366629 Transcript_115313/m.366629 type:complete len:215 (+) Transcript_115313:487-1131(+)